jgi:hypothetical protein
MNHKDLQPDVEAKKTIEKFHGVAEGTTSMQEAWNMMATDSKAFKMGSQKDHEYFKAVDEGLRKSGLMPELTIKYAQMHKDDLEDGRGDIAPRDIRNLADHRMVENHRLTEVERDFLGQLSSNFQDFKKMGERLTGEYSSRSINDTMLDPIDRKLAGDRHHALAEAQRKAIDTATANEISRDFSAGGGRLFRALSDSNGGRFIDQNSINSALEYDTVNRQRADASHQKHWHSYLNYEDHVAVQRLEGKMDVISHSTGRVTQADIAAFAKKEAH